MATRIHVVLARDAPVGVILRRGPTKQVRLLRWDLRTDEIIGGQWLAGRVYDERCGLSPDGELMVYFAMRKGHTWNAVSRPPCFTPLAVWEQDGTYGGGGMFVSNRRLLLRTNPACMVLDPKYTLPEGFEVAWTGEGRPAVAGEWTYRQRQAQDITTPSGRPRPSGSDKPFIRERMRPGDPSIVLEAHPVVVEDPNGPFEASEYVLRDVKRARTQLLGELDWADWDRNGDLLYARDGELLRAAVHDGEPVEIRVLRRMVDERFTAMPPPAEAMCWPPSAMGAKPRQAR